MLQSQHRFVQMKSERIRMVQRRDDWVVTADFVFENHGPRTKVTMGFPESSYSEATSEASWRVRPSFGSFTSWVDGQRAKVRRVVTTKGSNDFNALWIKQVSFGPRQTRRVRVRYLSSGGGDSNGGSFVSYNFTGGNWRGKVEKSVLTVEFTQSGAYYVAKPYIPPTDKPAQVPHFERRGRQMIYTWLNWEAQQDFDLYFAHTIPGALHDARYGLPTAQGNRAPDIITIPADHLDAGRQPHSSIPLVAFWRDGELWASCNWLAQGATLKGREYPISWNEGKRQIEISLSNHRPVVVKASGATSRLSKSSDQAVWIHSYGRRQLFVPAEPLARQLGFRLVVNRQKRLVRAVPLR